MPQQLDTTSTTTAKLNEDTLGQKACSSSFDSLTSSILYDMSGLMEQTIELSSSLVLISPSQVIQKYSVKSLPVPQTKTNVSISTENTIEIRVPPSMINSKRLREEDS